MEETKSKERINCVNEISGDIWEKFYNGIPIAIPTDGSRDIYGFNTMVKGLTKDAKELFPKLPKLIGRAIKRNKGSNGVFLFHLPTSKTDEKGNMEHNFLFTFPSKVNFWDNLSPLWLIEKSATKLVETLDAIGDRLGIKQVIIPRVGCGHGNRNWETEIKPILIKILDDRFLVIEKIEDAYGDAYGIE